MKTDRLKNIARMSIFPVLSWGLISSCSQILDRQTNQDRQNSGTVNSQPATLIVSAAASMQDALQEINRLYLKKYPEAKIIFNFGSSGSLQRQIEQGAPVDIFISAASQQMNELAAKDLVLTTTRRNLVENKMVLIVPPDNQAVTNFKDLTKESIEQIALGEPNSVPAGKYAHEILTNLNLANKVNLKTVYGKDVRQVLNYVATGNTDAGIVYSTDAKSTKGVKVVAIASPKNHSTVEYPIAVVKDSQYPQAAKQMLEFFFAPQAQVIFQKYGFVPASNQQSNPISRASN